MVIFMYFDTKDLNGCRTSMLLAVAIFGRFCYCCPSPVDCFHFLSSYLLSPEDKISI